MPATTPSAEGADDLTFSVTIESTFADPLPATVVNVSTVAELMQVFTERPETCHVTAFHLEFVEGVPLNRRAHVVVGYCCELLWLIVVEWLAPCPKSRDWRLMKVCWWAAFGSRGAGAPLSPLVHFFPPTTTPANHDSVPLVPFIPLVLPSLALLRV